MSIFIILYLLILAGVVTLTWQWFRFYRAFHLGGAVVWLGLTTYVAAMG